MNREMLRVLIVEDTVERQKILRSLYREHAWVLVNTASRAICLLQAYEFDLVSLDYDLAGPSKGDEVAEAIRDSQSDDMAVLVHAMNHQGAKKIAAILPDAVLLPISKMTNRNKAFKSLRSALSSGKSLD